MPRAKKGERKIQILQTMAVMLENPKGEKITTATLAEKLQVSEAALYRHFASKAQMYEGLIEFIESTLFTLINQISIKETDGLKQAHEIAMMLLKFAETNPGMTKVLNGDALVNEDERLQKHINHIIDKIELAFKQAFRHAAVMGKINDAEMTLRANNLTSFIVGRWQRYAKTHFHYLPTEKANQHIALFLK